MLQNSYLVVGKGHIGLATAAYLSNQGYTVYLFSRRSSIRPLAEKFCGMLKGFIKNPYQNLYRELLLPR
ncbi:NAD-binding protein [uncultured Nostoc sp.]|uniref:NAD-binding protein n=1 Tax=uncultured Nostoc sp. TaxID=340711 RepID=UPI0035CBEFF9